MADQFDPLKDARDHYDMHDSITGEPLSTDEQFPDRNLDVLHARTKSGMPERPSTQDKLAGLEAAVNEAVIAELRDLLDTVNTTTMHASASSFMAREISERIERRGGDGG